MTRARPARSVQRYGSRSPRVVLVAIAAFALALPLGIGMPPSVAAAGEAVFTPVADFVRRFHEPDLELREPERVPHRRLARRKRVSALRRQRRLRLRIRSPAALRPRHRQPGRAGSPRRRNRLGRGIDHLELGARVRPHRRLVGSSPGRNLARYRCLVARNHDGLVEFRDHEPEQYGAGHPQPRERRGTGADRRDHGRLEPASDGGLWLLVHGPELLVRCERVS